MMRSMHWLLKYIQINQSIGKLSKS